MNKSQKYKEKNKTKIILAIINGIVVLIYTIISVSYNKESDVKTSLAPDDLHYKPSSENSKDISLFQLSPVESGDSEVLLKRDESFGQYVQCIKLNVHGYIEMPDLLNQAKYLKNALIYNLNLQYGTFCFFLNSRTTNEDNCYLVIYLDEKMYNTYLLNEIGTESVFCEIDIKDVNEIVFVTVMENKYEELNGENYALIIEPVLY